MGAMVMLGILFGVGALLVIRSQPIGRPRPSLKDRLAELRPGGKEPEPSPEPVFTTPILEEVLRGPLEKAGRRASRLAARLGLDLEKTELMLKVSGDRGGIGLFWGQKVAGALVGFALVPAATSAGLIQATSVWVWVVLGWMGFVMPDMVLRSKAEDSLAATREQMALLGDLLSLSVSAGMGLEQAMEEAAASGEGVLFQRLRTALGEARMRGAPPSSAVRAIAKELGLDEASALAGALEAADTQGASISEALMAQTRSIRERRRIELVESGEKALVRMTLPVGLFIFPAFLVLILYPAAVQLLQITK